MISSGRYADKIAVVTGGAQGIGLAVATRMAREGATVIIADRAEDATMAAVAGLRSDGLDAYGEIHDLEKRDGACSLYGNVIERHGRVDVAVHNVGGTIWAKPFWDYCAEEIEAEINRSLWPTIWCCHAVLPHLLAAGQGAIVNVGSVATRGINRLPYAAAKGGVAALTVALAQDLEDRPIRVNCVAPGGVNVTRVTPRNPAEPTEADKAGFEAVVRQTLRDTPMARFGEVDEIAAAICFLGAPEASYITGQTLYVAGGGIG